MRAGPRHVALVATLAALTWGCARPAQPARDVLIVTLDTTRADHLGCYGDAAAATPTLDALAAGATLFEHAESPVPVTLPSHASMFTGLRPYRHGVRYNGSYVLRDDEVTLAERLRDAGFATGAVASSFAVAARFGLAQGFETYEDLFSGSETPQEGYRAERKAADAVDHAIDWWGKHAGRRRFLWVHVYDPHWPYAPPFPYSATFADRPYDGEIAYVDAELARLFAAVKSAGDWDSTLVIVAGDHGEGLYEHGERWHATLTYESTLHVPLIVKAPGQSSGRRVAEPVGLVDVTPTALDYAGAALPDGMDGISLRAAVDTGRAPARALYFECLAGNINYGWSPLIGIRDGSLKLVEGGRPELYDLGSDPGEEHDLAARDTSLLAEMTATLDGIRKEIESSEDAEAARVVDEETLAKLASLGYLGGGGGASSSTGAGVHPPDLIHLEQEFLRAQTAVVEQRWDDAATILDYVLSVDPKNKFGLFFRSKAQAKSGHWTEALTLAEAMSRLYPDSADAQDLLGHTLAQMGRTREAVAAYDHALERHPRDQRLRFHRYLVLVESGDLAAAERAVDGLEADFPTHYTTFVARARLEAREGHAEAALGALRSAVARGLGSLAVIQASPEFREIRGTPEYRALAAEVAARGAADEAVVTAKP